MTYTVSLAFLTITIFYSIILNILFFGKKHIKTEETKLFGKMVITNFKLIITTKYYSDSISNDAYAFKCRSARVGLHLY